MGEVKLLENEFLNVEGLVCCSKCKEPKQSVYEGHKFPVACRCRREQIEELERKEAQKKLEEKRVSAIQNPKFRSFTFDKDDLQDEETTKILKRYIAKFEELKVKGLGLLLWGNVGTGKTFYAHCIANALIDAGYSVKSTSLSTIVKLAQNFENGEREIDNILSYKVILIDDFGTERQTSFADEQIYNFIDKATSLNRVLIITTNFMPSEFEKAAQDTADLVHARIYSRILEKCYPVKVNKIKHRDALKEENRQFMKNLLQGEEV